MAHRAVPMSQRPSSDQPLAPLTSRLAAENTTLHQKRPSASSISSTSSASTGSRTAAFFSSHFDQPIRPAAASSSTSLASPAVKAGSIHRSPPTQISLTDSDAMHMGERTLSLSTSFDDPTQRHSGSYLSDGNGEYDGMGRSSNSIKRSWMTIEGKPITALPSPRIMEEERDNPHRQFIFPLMPESSQQGAARVAAPPSLHILTDMEPSTSTDSLVAPRTASFFGSSPTPRSASLASAKEGRRAATEGSTYRAPLSRHVSDNQALHTPSRLPSATAAHPTPIWALTSAAHGGTVPDSRDSTAHLSGIAEGDARGVAAFPTVPASIIDRSRIRAPLDRDHAMQTTDHATTQASTMAGSLPPIQTLDLTESTLARPANGQTSSLGTPTVGNVSSSYGAEADESEDETNGTVGPYQIERVLGVGAFSRVVLARRRIQTDGSRQMPSVGQPSTSLVALKMLAREPCQQNERMRVSWVREVEVLKHVVHPNVVRFLSSFSTQINHVLVLETVDGGELFEYLAHEQPEIAQREWLVRRIVGELANAVGWMHSIHLVHRDIKLENILLVKPLRQIRNLAPFDLEPTPLIKLSDFGLSRFVDPVSPLLETRCGSEEYAAPELIIGKRYDGRKTDVWAMGVVLYALLSGSLPFLDNLGTSQPGQGMINAREDSQQQDYQIDPRIRKAHLLRIAKGDLRWPEDTNDGCLDQLEGQASCPPTHRLITPPARLLVARLLRRDAAKRIGAWDVWDDDWMRFGSFAQHGGEQSARGQPFHPPLDPRSADGQAWIAQHARVHAGAPDVVHDD